MQKLPQDKIVKSYDQIDRKKYSSEVQYSGPCRNYTNIMSQVVTLGGGDFYDQLEQNSGAIRYLAQGNTLKEYIKRQGCQQSKINEVIRYMFQIMAKAFQEEGNMDILTAMDDGTMIRWYNEAMIKANAIEE